MYWPAKFFRSAERGEDRVHLAWGDGITGDGQFVYDVAAKFGDDFGDLLIVETAELRAHPGEVGFDFLFERGLE